MISRYTETRFANLGNLPLEIEVDINMLTIYRRKSKKVKHKQKKIKTYKK